MGFALSQYTVTWPKKKKLCVIIQIFWVLLLTFFFLILHTLVLRFVFSTYFSLILNISKIKFPKIKEYLKLNLMLLVLEFGNLISRSHSDFQSLISCNMWYFNVLFFFTKEKTCYFFLLCLHFCPFFYYMHFCPFTIVDVWNL